MQQITGQDLIKQAYTGNLQQKTTTLMPVSSETLTTEQGRAVNYFFSKMKQVYASKYKFIIKNDDEEKLQKQLYASELLKLSRDNIDHFFGEIAMSGLISGQKWPDVADLVGMITGLRVKDEDVRKSWDHFINRTVKQLWPDSITFEVVKRAGTSGNEFIANRFNNNFHEAYKAYKQLYSDVVRDILQGLELTDVTKFVEQKQGSNTNRTKADKLRIEKSSGYAAFAKMMNKGVE